LGLEEKDVQGGYLKWSGVVEPGVNAKILFLEESDIGVGEDLYGSEDKIPTKVTMSVDFKLFEVE
jgi:hypothetical protein